MESKTENISFLEHFSKIEDPQIGGLTTYPLHEIILITLCATLSGCDDNGTWRGGGISQANRL
jgi:hypothetical protein